MIMKNIKKITIPEGIVKVIRHNGQIIWQGLKRVLKTISGITQVSLLGCADSESLQSLLIKGDSAQQGAPTPDSPQEIIGIGEKTENLFDINSITFMKNSSGVIEGHIDGATVVSDASTCDFAMLDYVFPAGVYTVYKSGVSLTLYKCKKDSFGIDGSLIVQANASTTKAKFTLTEPRRLVLRIFTAGNTVSNIMILPGDFSKLPDRVYEPFNKYKVNLNVQQINSSSIDTYTIILDKPLLKIGDYADYIDCKNKKVIRNVGKGTIVPGFIYRKCNQVCRMSMTGLTGGIANTTILSPLFKSASAQWDSEEEIIFKHTSLPNHYYTSLTWDRLGLVYDGANVYKKGKPDTLLTDAQIVNIYKSYLNSFSEDLKYAYHPLSEPSEELLDIPDIAIDKGDYTISVEVNGKEYDFITETDNNEITSQVSENIITEDSYRTLNTATIEAEYYTME